MFKGKEFLFTTRWYGFKNLLRTTITSFNITFYRCLIRISEIDDYKLMKFISHNRLFYRAPRFDVNKHCVINFTCLYRQLEDHCSPWLPIMVVKYNDIFDINDTVYNVYLILIYFKVRYFWQCKWICWSNIIANLVS